MLREMFKKTTYISIERNKALGEEKVIPAEDKVPEGLWMKCSEQPTMSFASHLTF